jgi:hypothetical protein
LLGGLAEDFGLHDELAIHDLLPLDSVLVGCLQPIPDRLNPL